MLEFWMGLAVAMGLIIAIGAQNAWVLSMSVRRQQPWVIAATCFTIDALLMAVGIRFIGAVQQWLPWLTPVLTWVAVGLLLFLASQSAWRAWQGTSSLAVSGDAAPLSVRQALLAALAISLLNPHVYLDTVVLVGSVAQSTEAPWLFWSGSALASVLWFSCLAAIGRPLSRWLKSPTRWRIFDAIIATILCWVAAGLALAV